MLFRNYQCNYLERIFFFAKEMEDLLYHYMCFYFSEKKNELRNTFKLFNDFRVAIKLYELYLTYVHFKRE